MCVLVNDACSWHRADIRTGIPRFIALRFIALHRYHIFFFTN